jgi:hypothetical protein
MFNFKTFSSIFLIIFIVIHIVDYFFPIHVNLLSYCLREQIVRRSGNLSVEAEKLGELKEAVENTLKLIDAENRRTNELKK